MKSSTTPFVNEQRHFPHAWLARFRSESAAIRSFLWCESNNFCSEILAFLNYCSPRWRRAIRRCTTWKYHYLFSFCRWKGLCCPSFVMAYAPRTLISIDRQKSVCLSHIVQAQVHTFLLSLNNIFDTTYNCKGYKQTTTFPSTQWQIPFSQTKRSYHFPDHLHSARCVCALVFGMCAACFIGPQHMMFIQLLSERSKAQEPAQIWTVFAWNRANVSWARIPWVIGCSPVKRTKPSDIFDGWRGDILNGLLCAC